ncbi:AI-2E family transporter [Shimia sagamensis]|uniref:Predicted PurR-regulated permease PerM n=1 Tax=Shimia sagamensis TaxID=1566352 RepID=A0ABY1NI50_9RHOB|nr:AI-2E family transporter [Shimia sagamensis]SMP10128.1 Predicted PurR-regulated permease PerM [Shimia sagamensis]
MNRSDEKLVGRGMTLVTQVVLCLFFGVAGLKFGASVLVPLSLAVLLFVLISAIIDRFKGATLFGMRTPDWIAHVLAFGSVVIGVAIILSILTSQAGAVSEAFPRYEARFAHIVSQFASLIGDEAFSAAKAGVAEMNLSNLASGALSSASGFLSALFLVILYVAFLMGERAPMRQKLALAIPDAHTHEKVLAIADSMSNSLQRYVSIKTFVSILTAVGCYIFMKPVGLDFAETWAVLAFMLNFIPTIGSILGVVLPTIVALVQFDSTLPILVVVLGCGSVQFTIGNVLEPKMTGRSLNLSPFLVILSLTFWTAVWGIPGALMSVPLTVCIMIVLSHIPATRPLAVLMSGDGYIDGDPSKGQEVYEETSKLKGNDDVFLQGKAD